MDDVHSILNTLLSNNLLIKRGGIEVPLPVNLLPITWPQSSFKLVWDIQPIIQKLYYRCLLHPTWLKEQLACIPDSFVQRLFVIWRSVGIKPILMNITRSDYLLDEVECPKQVEVNTISCSFPHFASKFSKLFGCEVNDADVKIIECMEEISLTFKKKYQLDEVIQVMVVDGKESNTSDQMGIMTNKMRRLTFKELEDHCILLDNGHLKVNDQIVGLVYFRHGYSPNHYPTEMEWKVRMMLERSNAICVPDIGSHLMGLKKIQKVLCDPIELKKFLDDDEVEKLLPTFTEMKSLSLDSEGEENVRIARQEPERWVLKPQREGGGNNIYGEEIKSFLDQIDPPERSSFILMELIKSPAQPGKLLSNDGIIRADSVISELGIFGVFTAYDNKLIINKPVGYLVRSKPVGVREGGIISGFGYLSNLSLTD